MEVLIVLKGRLLGPDEDVNIVVSLFGCHERLNPGALRGRQVSCRCLCLLLVDGVTSM